MNENEKSAKVEKLSKKAGVSMDEARMALEQNGWDMLDALLFLQNTGKTGQAGPDVYSTQGNYTGNTQNNYQYQNNSSTSFKEACTKGFNSFVNLVKKGMDNDFVIERKTMNPIRIPITIAIILAILLNGLVLILLIVGLFAGFRYSLMGPDIRNTADEVNDVLHKAGQKAEEFTNDIKDGFREN